jgi:CheY-like chemotaxis protein
MPDGGAITVKTANMQIDHRSPVPGLSLEPGEYVMLAVIDEGAGIPPDVLTRVTEPYFTTKALGSGTGLGLSMVNQFARETGGAMHIASTVGMGTTVTMYLPRGLEGDPPSEEAGQQIQGKHENPEAHILIVEDDDAVRKNVASMMRDMGYRTTESETGDAALEMLRGGLQCDLVFSDIALPGENSGRDLAREIPKISVDCRILLTTGVPDHTQDSKLLNSGIPILAKPYRYEELADAIRNALKT